MSEPAVSSTPSSPSALTPRQQLKADRRDALLAAAKRLIAKHGYLGVRLEDIGGAAGVSGPAVYRHFPSKDAVLAALLVGISHTLHDGGQRIKQSAASPSQALLDLVAWQLDFALSDPELDPHLRPGSVPPAPGRLARCPPHSAGLCRDLGRRDPGGRAVRQRGGGPHPRARGHRAHQLRAAHSRHEPNRSDPRGAEPHGPRGNRSPAPPVQRTALEVP